MISPKEKYDFKRKLEELRDYNGRATELISLYIPSTKQISDVAAYLRNEYSQSSNIKSKSTKKNVMSAIESILSRLRHFKKVSENGVVFFVGHVSIGANQTNMIAEIIEPPEKNNTFLYRCDSSFFLEPLEGMLVEKEIYGLIVIDRQESTIGLLKGKRVETIKNIQSRVPSKHTKGGWSQRRFERLIEIAAHEYYKKVGDLASDVFLELDLLGLLVGGPGSTKDFFVEKDYLHHELKKKLISTYDTGYTSEYGLRELVNRADETLEEIDLMREKRLMRKFTLEVIKDNGLATYGENEVRQSLENGAVDTILISEALRKNRIKSKCSSCDYTKEETGMGSTKCRKCGSQMEILEKIDIIEDLTNKADDVGTKVELISEDSDEGETLIKAFGGIAAILRYK